MNFSEARSLGRLLVLVLWVAVLWHRYCLSSCSNLSATASVQLGPATVSQPAWRAFIFHHILPLQVNSKVQTICFVCLSGPGLPQCSGCSRRPFLLCPNNQLLLTLPITFQYFLGSHSLSSHYCKCFIKLMESDRNAEGKRITDSYRHWIKFFLHWKTSSLAERDESKSWVEHDWFSCLGSWRVNKSIWNINKAYETSPRKG